MTHSILKMPKDPELYNGKEFSIIRKINEDDIIKFGQLSQNYAPLHFSEELAAKTRFVSRIEQRMLTVFVFSKVLEILCPWCDYKKIEIQFINPIRIEDEITVTGKIHVIIGTGDMTNIIVLLDAKNQNDEKVASGTAEMIKLAEMYQTEKTYPVLHSEPI